MPSACVPLTHSTQQKRSQRDKAEWMGHADHVKFGFVFQKQVLHMP